MSRGLLKDSGLNNGPMHINEKQFKIKLVVPVVPRTNGIHQPNLLVSRKRVLSVTDVPRHAGATSALTLKRIRILHVSVNSLFQCSV